MREPPSDPHDARPGVTVAGAAVWGEKGPWDDPGGCDGAATAALTRPESSCSAIAGLVCNGIAAGTRVCCRRSG